jgi:hypothetical protein
MESQRLTAIRESPERRGIDGARVTIERAERAWRQRVKQEEAGLPAATYARLRWLLLGVCLAAIVLLLFQRLGQLG